MIELHYWPTPNGWKITIALEELGLTYAVRPVDIGRGEQFGSDFLALNPNGRIPVLVDTEPIGGGPPVVSFESGAMLLYLADKAGALLPAHGQARQTALSWLMWQMSAFGPMLGQHGHFKLYAAEPVPYALQRYEREARRLYGVLDAQLARAGPYVCGDQYSMADVAIFPWAMTHKAQGFTLADWPHVQRWYALLRGREALQRGLAVGRDWRSAAPTEQVRSTLFGAPPAPSGPKPPNPPPGASPDVPSTATGTRAREE